MPMTRRTTITMWRWRRNRLRRRSDTIEAWVLLAAWVLAAPGALVAAAVTTDVSVHRFDQQRRDSHPVTAVLTQRAASAATARAVDDDQVWATIRWSDPDGVMHTGRTKVAPGTPAGTPVPVWADGHGHLVSKPSGPATAEATAVSNGALAAAGVTATAYAGTRLVRRRLDRRRMAAWAAEWEQASARWGGRTG
ncbi:hypothetical protein ABTX35_00670 [Streptomyces sp. NPDC096080]|uniref:Rv1733c family protein n=1 Tax=Streptomyces sp. NPDC096080 TaxID=3156693 RepID=UPI00331E25A7